MKNGTSFLGYLILALLVGAFSYGPIERLSYQIPDSHELNTLVGTIEFRRGWKGGERIFIKSELGNTTFTCRISSAWLQADCPISTSNKKSLEGKGVAIQWHKQARWPLTTSEKQIYGISMLDGGGVVVEMPFMIEHYKKQKSMFGSLLLLILIIFVITTVVVVRRYKNNQI
jgi:hypothetical protein